MTVLICLLLSCVCDTHQRNGVESRKLSCRTLGNLFHFHAISSANNSQSCHSKAFCHGKDRRNMDSADGCQNRRYKPLIRSGDNVNINPLSIPISFSLPLLGGHMLIIDCESNDIVERFPSDFIQQPISFSHQDHIYDNILIFTVRHPDESQGNISILQFSSYLCCIISFFELHPI